VRQKGKKVGMILIGIIGVSVLGPEGGWSAFEVTDKGATLDSPPENPSPLRIGDWLTVQSDHKIKVKKVNTQQPSQFWIQFRNNETCTGGVKKDPEQPQAMGAGWAVNQEQEFTSYDLFQQSQMTRPGYFTANALTDWCQFAWTTVANDSHAFQVQGGGGP